MFYGYSYLLLIVVTLVIGCVVSGYVNRQLSKYSRVPISNGLTGAEVAQQMLAFYQIPGVSVVCGTEGQDFFNPKNNTVSLSPSAYNGRSITATATACHEVGHAYQYAEGYTPMKIRGALVPAVNLASNGWIFLLMLGIFMNLLPFVYLAIILYGLVVAFQLITLPVELNASHRAMTYMESIALPQSEQSGAFSVLKACAYTYLAAALTSILQLLWIIGRTR
ncbi:MAG: zinc metallopeptidase [Eggerthellaceae bacterium]|jgi:Zn-dependent membrane protease YugP